VSEPIRDEKIDPRVLPGFKYVGLGLRPPPPPKGVLKCMLSTLRAGQHTQQGAEVHA